MTPEERQFLKDAFQSVADRPLDAHDPRYVSLSEARGEDAGALLARGIEFSSGESVQFVCGLPGTGVTSELLSEFWVAADDGYYERHFRYLDCRNGGEWHLVGSLKKEDDGEVVVVDHLSSRGDTVTIYLDSMRKEGLHVIYVLPWTFVFGPGRDKNLARIDKYGPLYWFPSLQLRDVHGDLVHYRIEAFKQLLAKRFDTQRLFASDASLLKIIHASGGNVRDCLRLTQEVLRRAISLPVEPQVVDAAITFVQNGRLSAMPVHALPLLARIAQTHELAIEDEKIEDVERWAESGLFLQYRNGRDWYDVHPLIRDVVVEKARSLQLAAPKNDGQKTEAVAPPAVLAPVTLAPAMQLTVFAEEYRALRQVQWTIPRGVSVLVGPNGSGKTTLLDVPELLRHALEYDIDRALDIRGARGNLRHASAERQTLVKLGISLDSLSWQMEMLPRGLITTPLVGERGLFGETVVFDRQTQRPIRTDEARVVLGRFSELPEGAAFRPLVTLVQGYRFYKAYDLDSIRKMGSKVSADEYLHVDGSNVFSVLRNWRDRKETRPRWEFVIDNLKAAFPDTFENLDFEVAGQLVSGRIMTPKPDENIPTHLAANGWLIALLHLAAVASTQPAGVVAIDEIENGLHPHAIRRLIEAMRDWAAQTGISVVVSTHSPVVLDQFKEEPDHLFVMEPGRERLPIKLDELHDPEWLAHFSLGDLYAHDEFGAQGNRGESSP